MKGEFLRRNAVEIDGRIGFGRRWRRWKMEDGRLREKMSE